MEKFLLFIALKNRCP